MIVDDCTTSLTLPLDYVLSGDSLGGTLFLTHNSDLTVTVSIQDDLRLEGNEMLTFTFVVDGVTGAVTVNLPPLEITIQDDEGRSAHQEDDYTSLVCFVVNLI